MESPASNQHGGSPEREHSKESRRTTKKKRDNSGRPGSSSSAENIALSAPKLDVVSPEDQTRPPQLSPVSTVADLGGEAIVPQLPSVEVKGIRKRTLSTSSGHSDDYASSLTPLTSPADARVKPLFPPTTNIAPRLARQFMRAQARAQSASRAHGKLKMQACLTRRGLSIAYLRHWILRTTKVGMKLTSEVLSGSASILRDTWPSAMTRAMKI